MTQAAFHAYPSHIDKREEQALIEDIAYFEARLEQMGDLGDCAYERAMTRFYERLVGERRVSLARLRTGRGGVAEPVMAARFS
jgi:hypothetical protein